VPAAVGMAGVLGAAAPRAAGDDTADRAQLHPRIVDGEGGAVYSLVVLGPRDESSAHWHRPPRTQDGRDTNSDSGRPRQRAHPAPTVHAVPSRRIRESAIGDAALSGHRVAEMSTERGS
jgi:hypothetical protein